MVPEEIFTPGIFPEHTYVHREEERFENLLGRSLMTPGMLTSVLGPSKSGKTVLLKRVVGDAELRVSGITNAPALWKRVLALLNVAVPKSKSSGTSTAATTKAGISDPVLGVSAGGEIKSETTEKGTSEFEEAPFDQAVKNLKDRNKVLVLDDFHYVGRAAQVQIARQLKEAISRGAKIVVLAVPHGADDPIRANPDLRGRVFNVDLGSWSVDELCEIGKKGFPKLGYTISADDLRSLANEALGSPQLMQALCLFTCRLISERSSFVHNGKITLDQAGIADICRATSAITEAKTPFGLLAAGPQRHGTERNNYKLRGGESGDVYTVVLRALRESPPRLTLSYEELRARIAEIVDGTPPLSQQWVQALSQMHTIVQEKLPRDRVLEWDNETKIASIADPYFLFFLRWSVWPK